MKRREFLFHLPAGLILANACSFARTRNDSQLRGQVFVAGVIPAEVPKVKYFEVLPDAESYLVFFNAAGSVRRAGVPFEVHSVMHNPKQNNLALLVPKWGQSLAIFDLKRWETKQLISVRGEKRRFFGHAVWEDNGDFFWVTERDDLNRRSLVSRWSKDLRQDRGHLTNSDYAHEVQWTQEGQLLVANSGTPFASPGLSWINPTSGKVDRFIDCKSTEALRYIPHFIQLPSLGKVFGIGKNNQEKNESLLLSVEVGTGRVRALPVPEWARPQFRGESISIGFDEITKQLIVTSMGGDGFQTLWNPEKEEFIGGSSGMESRGVMCHRGEVFITCNRGRTIRGISNEPLIKEPFSASDLDPALWEWGSHIGRLYL